MKAYFIFAIALTVAYIIYYAVMIARDLYGKNGEKIKSGEEEFDVSDFDEEESVSVVETTRDSISEITSMRHTTSTRHRMCRRKQIPQTKSRNRMSSRL